MKILLVTALVYVSSTQAFASDCEYAVKSVIESSAKIGSAKTALIYAGRGDNKQELEVVNAEHSLNISKSLVRTACKINVE